MKEVIYYEANDGKRFEDEQECVQYEFNKGFEPIAEMLMMWDGDGNKIEITYRTDPDRAYAIYCSSITAAIFLKEWGERDGVVTPYSDIDIEGRGEVPLGKFIYFNAQWIEITEAVALFEKMSRQMSDNEEKIFMPMM
jgi:hypothetical protein